MKIFLFFFIFFFIFIFLFFVFILLYLKKGPKDELHKYFIELATKERSYVKSLREINEDFLDNLRIYENNTLEQKTNQMELKSIFSNIEEIYKIHKEFLELVDKQIEVYPELIFDQFCSSFVDKLIVYNQYLSNHSTCVFLFDLFKKNSHFSHFLSFFEKKRSLKDLLSRPLDVVPSYLVSFQHLITITANKEKETEKSEIVK